MLNNVTVFFSVLVVEQSLRCGYDDTLYVALFSKLMNFLEHIAERVDELYLNDLGFMKLVCQRGYFVGISASGTVNNQRRLPLERI